MFRVQDTPGYGDDPEIQKHIDMLTDFIAAQNRKYLKMESARDRNLDLIEAEDPRVDACIYCMPPHRVRPNDIR